MKVYVDSENKIRDVGSTTDTTLTELTINDEDNPFEGWSKAKICCYMVTVIDGVVTMMTPYIDSKMLDMVDRLGKQNDILEVRANDTELVLDDIMTNIIPEIMR